MSERPPIPTGSEARRFAVTDPMKLAQKYVDLLNMYNAVVKERDELRKRVEELEFRMEGLEK